MGRSHIGAELGVSIGGGARTSDDEKQMSYSRISGSSAKNGRRDVRAGSESENSDGTRRDGVRERWVWHHI